jgi:hypothetical protein
MVTQRTLDAHNKLYFLEFDHITHVAPTMISEPQADVSGNLCKKEIPGAKSKCKSLAESLNLMWRDFILCYANRTAMWWFDMFDGWFRSGEMMGAIGKMISLHEELSERDKRSVARVALYAEGESMYHTRKSAGIARSCLSDIRRILAESGAAYDLYSVSDLDNLEPYEYRFIIMLNAYEIPKPRLERIRSLQKRGVTVLWLYAPNYVNGNDVDVGRISEAVGFEISESDVSHGGLIYDNRICAYTEEAPYFSVTDSGVCPIAFFEDGAVAVATDGDDRSIYSALPFVSSSLLRELLRGHGIPIYSESPHVYVYPNADAVCVYNATECAAVISEIEDGEYTDRITMERFLAKDGRLVLPPRELRAYILLKE